MEAAMSTPVRVRGKRKARGDGAAGAAAAKRVPWTARKMLRLSVLPCSSAAAAASAASAAPAPVSATALSTLAHRVGTRPRLLRLDCCLPVEILAQIFVLSENVNLARSNPRLSRMLSGRGTRLSMVMAAFGPTWDAMFGRLWAAPREIVPGDADFQSTILACPWVRMPLLLDAQQAWIRRCTVSPVYTHLMPAPGPDMDPDTDLDMDMHLDMAPDVVPDAAQRAALLRAHPLCYAHDFASYAQKPPQVDDAALKAGVVRSTSAGGDVADTRALPRPSPPCPNIHACFALEQALALQTVCAPVEDEDLTPPPPPPGRAAAATAAAAAQSRRRWLAWCRRLTIYGFGSTRVRHVHVHPRTRIPEWLLLAGGPYGGDEHDPSPDAVRRRLRVVVDELLWLVAGGARLQPADSWEVTRLGFTHLMNVDVAAETRSAESEPADKLPDGPPDIPYSTDVLVVAVLALFCSLGVFWPQWPAAVRDDALAEAARRATRDRRGFGRSRTCAFVRRLAVHATEDQLTRQRPRMPPPPRGATVAAAATAAATAATAAATAAAAPADDGDNLDWWYYGTRQNRVSP